MDHDSSQPSLDQHGPGTESSGARRVTAALAGPSAAAHRGLAAAALVSLAALAACSSSNSSSAPPSSATVSPASIPSSTAPPSQPASPAVAGTEACANGSLQVNLGPAQGYAGGVYRAIDFTNTSGASCTLYGYPGVSLVSGSYAQIGLAAKRTTTEQAKPITLAPGATGNTLLQIVNTRNFPAATCSPALATELRIYPPDQTAAVYLPDSSQGCTQPVQILFVGVVRAGSA